MNRIGNYIQTASGKLFYPLDPRAEEVCIYDIAHALSQCARWTGHTREFYSVAQHACVVASLVAYTAPHLALAALHHDSAEAYLADICSPTKQFLWLRYENHAGVEQMESFSSVEDRVEHAILKALSIETPDQDGRAAIKTADRAALRWEAENLMSPFPNEDPIYTIGLIPHKWVRPWTSEKAESEFLAFHNALAKGH